MSNPTDTTQEPSPQALWTDGTRVGGHYTIVRRLGKGGMGSVWLARDESMREQVAIKAIADALSGKSDAVEKLREEARLTRPLSHPHIVRLHGLEEHDGAAMLVMEYLAGPTLQTLLQKRREASGGKTPLLAYAEIAAIMDQIAKGLAYAHERKIVHRDLKPLNLMFSSPIDDPSAKLDAPGQSIKICDFGIARRMQDDATHLDSPTRVFSVHYCSPEQIRDERIGTASDIYALGCILYECLAGRPPFIAAENREGGMASIMYQHLHQAPARLEGVAPELRELVEKCLAKDYRTRPTATDLIQASKTAAGFAARAATNPGATVPVFERTHATLSGTDPNRTFAGVRSEPPTRPARSVAAKFFIWIAVVMLLAWVGWEWLQLSRFMAPVDAPRPRPEAVNLNKD
jgi:serine/threonine-protein kinase